ncbi:MAG: acyl-CoA dehydrogenase [Leptolyngbyaceae cyanobacterium]
MSLLVAGLMVGLLGLSVAYVNGPMVAWFVYGALVLGLIQPSLWLWVLFGVVAVSFSVPFIRQVVITAPIVKTIRFFNLLPAISKPERAAIEAGTVWVDGELFSGKPNFKRMLAEPYPALNLAGQAFVEGPVEQVCRMATDWEIYQRRDLPANVWAYLRQERFFGMMIPPEYGGLGLSNTAYSAVMTKLASHSFAHTATVGSANSLGPVLLRYGTDEQKRQYLPKLATGEALSCFAMTAPMADTASLQASGTVFKGKDDTLSLRLNWQMSCVELGAISTLVGLTVRLRDPDNLLGKGIDVGMTCVLVPAETPGVQLGRRHDPMGVPFYSSPVAGRNVVLPASQIIGGVDQAGNGWTMLMHSLAAERDMGFPIGVAKLVSRVAGAYSVVREQSGLSTSNFNGVAEPLARIGSLTYLMDAARQYTCGAMDQGEQPAVVSAIVQYQFPKLSRQMINDGMDILGNAGICRGPRNLLANSYAATPVTREDTNILSHSLMIGGQGAMRCHGYIVDEIAALEDNNVAAFDHAFWRHVGLVLRNFTRAKVLGWTQGRLVKSPVRGETARYYQKLAWASATFAALSDLAMLTYGGRLKRHEKITGRFADMFSWMYLATAALRRFEAEGRRQEDLPLVHWAMNHGLGQIQHALEGLLTNLDIPVLGGLLRSTTLPWFRLNPIGVMPNDSQGHAVGNLLQSPDGRNYLTQGLYVPTDAKQPLGRLERAYQLSVVAMPVFEKIKVALRDGQLNIVPPVGRVEAALRAGVITGAESDLAITAERAQLDALQMDSFTLTEYQRLGREFIEKEIKEAE